MPFAVMPAKGFAGTQYRPEGKNIVGKPRHQCHLGESQFGQFLASNTDYHKEMVQRGFLVASGSAGAVSLWGHHAEHHAEFSEHICAEVLSDKAEGARGTFWKWVIKPGSANDWLDALTGCFTVGSWFMGASDHNAEGHGQRNTNKQKKKEVLRKPKIRIEE